MTSRSRRRSSADAAYRLLLRIYPRSYRERFAGQMRETFLAELDQARGADSWRLIPFWLVTAIQAVWFGIRERLAARAAARLEPTPPRLGPGLVAGLKLLRAPRELPAIVVALAVGVGLTAAAYSLIHAVLLTPLPYRDPDTLVQVWRPDDVLGSRRNLSDRSREALAAAPSPFVSVASYGTVREPLMRADSGGAAITAAGALVTGSAFDVLGVTAATGRTLRPEDARLTASPPIVVSETLVRTGVLEGRIGERVDLGGVTYRLVGTMPEGFWFPDRASVFWIPILDVPPELRGTATFTITRPTIARLAPGVTAAIAEARSRARLESADTSRRAPEVQVASYGRLLTGSVRPSLLALQGASTLVLLLVCVNVSWLYGARARRLSSSYATMRALGATTGHLTCAHLVSAFGVAVVAAPLAVLLAWALLHAGMTLESGVFSRTAEPAITRHVVGVACLTTLAASFASSLPSIATVARTRALRGQTVRRRAGERWGIGAQLALVFALGGQAVFVALVLASLFRTNVGLPRTDYLVAILEARGPVVADPRVQLARFSSLLDRLELRGIRAAASTLFPFTRYDNGSTFERARSRDQERASVRVRAVTPGYFQLTGQIATQGRLLAEQDAGARRIVVNDVFQAAVLHGREVLGAATGGDNQWTIVGVTKAVRQATVDEEVRPEAYILYEDFVADDPARAARAMRRAYVLVEPRRGLAETIDFLRQDINDVMPDMDVRSVSHARELIGLTLGASRLVAAGSAAFAAVALLLAALGLHAAVSHGLLLRGREIGIRLALGATPGRIAVESMGPVAAVCSVGVGGGLALLISARSALQAIMAPPPGVPYPSLVAVAGAASAVLALAITAACYRPIRTAASTDPSASLRTE